MQTLGKKKKKKDYFVWTRIFMQKRKKHLGAEYAVKPFGHLFPLHCCGHATDLSDAKT